MRARLLILVSYCLVSLTSFPGFSATSCKDFSFVDDSIDSLSARQKAQLFLSLNTIVDSNNRRLISEQLGAQGFEVKAFLGRSFLGASAVVAESDRYQWIIFRGSQKIKEWIRNVLFWQDMSPLLGIAGRVHFGMARQFLELVEELAKLESRGKLISSKPTILVGHSLGAVMASLHGLWLKRQGYPVAMVGMTAAPRMGDQLFLDDLYRQLDGRIMAVELDSDLTPVLPPSFEAAQVFSEILPVKASKQREKLKSFVESLSYGIAPWPILRISKDIDSLDKLSYEIKFWKQLQIELSEDASIEALFSAFSERTSQHAPETYRCALLESDSLMSL